MEEGDRVGLTEREGDTLMGDTLSVRVWVGKVEEEGVVVVDKVRKVLPDPEIETHTVGEGKRVEKVCPPRNAVAFTLVRKAVGEKDWVVVPDTVWEAEAHWVVEREGEGQGQGVWLLVTMTVEVVVEEGVDVEVPMGVLKGVPDADPVLEGDAPAVKEGVGDTEMVEVALRLGIGVPLSD